MSFKPSKDGPLLSDSQVQSDVSSIIKSIVSHYSDLNPDLELDKSVAVMAVGGGSPYTVLLSSPSLLITSSPSPSIPGVEVRCLFFKSNEGVCQSSSHVTLPLGTYHPKMSFEYHHAMVGGLLMSRVLGRCGGGGSGEIVVVA
ncbi:hypothetical protein TrRE_jg3503 [Triparma retinervis]|uniref:Uncharacterized protein n=1 Tax=Triparma retinervis TaxID=2557542 RepID=A0A9W6ZTV3_9STRA|nr:hypothetical protein TrRE_jg3503 [Triparma retinervis]